MATLQQKYASDPIYTSSHFAPPHIKSVVAKQPFYHFKFDGVFIYNFYFNNNEITMILERKNKELETISESKGRDLLFFYIKKNAFKTVECGSKLR